jgi:general secretion pathway protein J
MTRPIAQRGFSLVEVVIATAIMAVVVAETYGVFYAQEQTRSIVTSLGERDQELRGSLLRMSREISMAFISDHFDRKRFRDRPTFFTGKGGGNDDTLMFTSMAHQRLYTGAKESDQAVFEYKLENDPDDPSKRALVRRVKAIIDEDPDRGGDKQVLATDITGFDVEYWDEKKREWKREWDTTRSDQATALPTRVRVTLLIKDNKGGNELRYSTQASVAMPTPLAF